MGARARRGIVPCAPASSSVESRPCTARCRRRARGRRARSIASVVRQPDTNSWQSVRIQPAGAEGVFVLEETASFYTSLDIREVFSRPYAPHYLNHLLPVVYSDWWGDYWRYFEIPIENISTPSELPAKYEAPRIQQSYVGVVPSLFGALGFGAFFLLGTRRREPALLLIPGAVLLLALQFLVFQIAYPHADGDTIKATYLLNAVAPFAVCAAYALGWLRRAGRLLTIAVFSLLVYAAVLDISFLVLRT